MSSLEHLYLGEDSPYALSGNTQQLLEGAHALGIPQKEAERYLQGEPSFTLHRPRRVQFPRSKTVVGPRLDSTWQTDLVEMQNRKLIAKQAYSLPLDDHRHLVQVCLGGGVEEQTGHGHV